MDYTMPAQTLLTYIHISSGIDTHYRLDRYLQKALIIELHHWIVEYKSLCMVVSCYGNNVLDAYGILGDYVQ